MLLQFQVENYKSIKKMAVLSMEASSDKEHPENVVTFGKDRVLTTAAVFGANAAGKSNLFMAFTAAILMIRRSNLRQIGEPLFDVIPFKFDTATLSMPTKFEFVFRANEKKYVYGFSATNQRIIDEYLYVYKTAKPTTIFERTDTNQYRYYSAAAKKELKPIEIRNTENKLFLATAGAWNSEMVKEPLSWFMTKIDTYSTDFTSLFNQAIPFFDADHDGSLKRFTSRLMREADIHIDDYIFESKEISKENYMEMIPPVLEGLFPTTAEFQPKKVSVKTLHRVYVDEEVNGSYVLSLNEESEGTKNLFALSPIFKDAFEKGRVICVDELDTSLHPALVTFLVGLFNNPEINKANAQLIFSTHSTELLSLKEMRRDQFYFVEKDRDSGVSQIYSLDEFSPRIGEDIRKAYLVGRYGAVPDIGEGNDL